MASAVSTLKGLDKIIREDLMFQERVLEPKVDGIFSKMYDTSAGVVSGGGRVGSTTGGFTVIHTFATGVAGAFRNLAAGGDNDIDPDITGQSIMYSPSVTFPGATDAVAPGYVQKTVTLVEGLGVFALPLHLIMAEQLDATIAKPVSLTIKGTAKNVAQSEANNFYATDGQNIALCTLVKDVNSSGNASVTFTNANATDDQMDVVMGIQADVIGRVGRFYPGMTCSIFKSDFTVERTTGTLIVTNVDYVGRTVSFVSLTGVNLNTLTQEANDVITLWTSGDIGAVDLGYGPSGIDKWTVSGSSSVFGIDQTTHSQFNSVVSAVNNVLDQAVLDTNIGAFYDAYSDMCDLDSMITTAGVINNYIENTDGLWRYERHNTGALKLKEGWTSFDYTYQGRNFELLQSRYVTNGVLYACKLADQNLKRYVPPRIPSAGKRSEFAPEIQWLGPIVGSNSIFLPARNSSAKLTRFVEAPFFCQREICPEQLQGVKLTGLTELFA